MDAIGYALLIVLAILILFFLGGVLYLLARILSLFLLFLPSLLTLALAIMIGMAIGGPVGGIIIFAGTVATIPVFISWCGSSVFRAIENFFIEFFGE